MAIADNFDHNSDAGSSAPMTRAMPGRNFRFRSMLGIVLALPAVALEMLTQLAPPIAPGGLGAQREQPSNRGNVTGHSRLT